MNDDHRFGIMFSCGFLAIPIGLIFIHFFVNVEITPNFLEMIGAIVIFMVYVAFVSFIGYTIGLVYDMKEELEKKKKWS